MRNLIAIAVAGTLLAGCASGPDYKRPALELPVASTADSRQDLSRWWQDYNDPTLNALVDTALANNQDLRAAGARVDEARALLDSARVDYLPDVGIGASSSRTRPSHKTASYVPGTPDRITQHQATLNVSYELDLWGKVRRANEAAAAQLAASREARHAAQSAIAAQVAQTYFQLRGLDHKVDVANKTLATRDESVKLQERRFKAGVISSLDLAQSKSEREAIAAALPALKAAQSQAERALAVLVGRSPRDVAAARIARPASSVALPNPPAVPTGLPANLLEQRPDLREAEANLQAASAQIGVARAQYYPSISLTGAWGSASEALGDLFSGPALMWNAAASLAQPLVGLKRIDAQVGAAEARSRQAEAAYAKAVQQAFKETLDALNGMSAARDSANAQQRRIDALEQSLKLSELRYKAGQSGYLELLDAQRNLYSTTQDQLDAQVSQLTSSVDVFRALGGGWSSAEPTQAKQ